MFGQLFSTIIAQTRAAINGKSLDVKILVFSKRNSMGKAELDVVGSPFSKELKGLGKQEKHPETRWQQLEYTAEKSP